MTRALQLALRGWGRVAPNPLVGAVVVQDEKTVGEGWHAEYGGPHAEIQALQAAGAGTAGATLYVTLEPCAHHGKTPPCTDAILARGVTRVVYAAADPNPRARGGAEVLRARGLEVTAGVEEQAARDQNAPFFHRFNSRERPWIALKLAMSLDCAVADAQGRSKWITGDSARQETHRLRAGFDAIGVGSGTALEDDPQLTVRGSLQPRRAPARVVWDRRLRMGTDSRLAQTAKQIPVWVLTGADASERRCGALEAAGVRVLRTRSLTEGLRALGDHGIDSLLVEGGAGITGALLAGDHVDRLYLFYAPLLLGAGALSPFAALPAASLESATHWRTLGTEQFGADTLITVTR